MSNKITETHLELHAIELFESQNYTYLAPEAQEAERQSLTEVILKDRLKAAIDRINPKKPEAVRDQAFKAALNLSSQNLGENNEEFHSLLTDGVAAEFLGKDGVRGDKVSLVDFGNLGNNEFLVCNQFTVEGHDKTKRPDIVLFVNGLPLVVIELKNPADENATVKKAYTQLQNYKTAIPQLFYYNALLIASDGLDAKAGSLTTDWSRFSAWKTVDGEIEDKTTVPQIETLISGMLRPDILLELIRHYTVFEKTKRQDKTTGQTFIETAKKIAAYHQYWAVKKAIQSTLQASSKKGNHKAGVIWHTQGSGKSLSMVFYAGKVVLEMGNPTIVVITDRNDLDDQLFDTFAASKQLLRQDPVQAESQKHLKKLLTTAGGGIVFTTIQKFFPEDRSETFDTLRGRSAIHEMAKEPRFSRRALSEHMIQAIRNFPKSSQPIMRNLSFMPSFYEGKGYVFLQLKVDNITDYENEYRPRRQAMLEIACGAAKNKFDHLTTVVGIAIDAPKYTKRNSEDFILMDCSQWTDELREQYERENEHLLFFKSDSLKMHKKTVTEFPKLN
jgi:type I restriction enzyme, R subunit